MRNKRCLPIEVKSLQDRENLSYKYYWNEEDNKISLHSYVVRTKSSGMKNVLALSTMPFLLATTKDDGKEKPALLKFYDFSKGGTDIVDQRIGMYTVNSKSRRWTMAAFAYILDTVRVNSQTMKAINSQTDPRKSNSFLFGWELVLALVTPHIITRKATTSTLQTSTVQKMKLILKTVDPVDPVIIIGPQLHPPSTVKRKRCYLCVEQIKGVGYTQQRNKMTVYKAQCQKCSKNICTEHTVTLCANCKL